jgi:hypothetical protein
LATDAHERSPDLNCTAEWQLRTSTVGSSVIDAHREIADMVYVVLTDAGFMVSLLT